MERAIRERWVNVGDLQQTLLSNLDADLLSESPRVRDAARKVLVAIVAQNQKDEHHRAVIELQRIRDQLTALLSAGSDRPSVGNAEPKGIDGPDCVD